MRELTLTLPLLATLAVACAGAASGVRVHRSGIAAPAKPAACELDVYSKAPPRPHDRLGELESHVRLVPPEGALSVVRPAACELGADAIVVDRNMVLNEFGHTFVAVTAIRYRAEGAERPAAPSTSPEAAPAEAPSSAPPK
jgi:hypothetical protein